MSLLAGLARRLGLRVAPQCLGHLQPAAAAAAAQQQRWRSAASGLTLDDLKEELDAINDAFVEARDEIDYCKEDAETVYFNESHDAARKAVDDVLDDFQALLGRLSEAERGKLQRSMGLKMEQLKAELAELDTLHD